MPGANDKPGEDPHARHAGRGASLFYKGRFGSAHPTPVRRPGPPALAAMVDRSGAAHTELHNMRPLMTMIDTPTERAESALYG
jgi:hypothetical protein